MTTTYNWVGGNNQWSDPQGWNPLGPPTASSVAMIGGNVTEAIPIEVPNAVCDSLILNDPHASVGIGGAAGAKLTVGATLAIENGTFGIGGLGTLVAHHIRIAAPAGQTTPTTGVLWFPGSGTIGATVQNNGHIEAQGPAGSLVDFKKEVVRTNTKGESDISNGGALEFDEKVVQNIAFGTGGGTLELHKPTAFDANGSGSISGWAAGDEIDLAGHWLLNKVQNPTPGLTEVTMQSPTDHHIFYFAGDLPRADFAVTTGATLTTIRF